MGQSDAFGSRGAENEDMFLELSLARSGKVNGESIKAGHENHIELVGWSWGMQAKTAMSGGGAAGKASVGELHVRKHFDRSSTAMLSALRSNETVRKAVVFVRKAGGKPFDYLSVSVENGRITGYNVITDGPRPIEEISFSFSKIAVTYQQQGDDGQLGGSMQYADELA